MEAQGIPLGRHVAVFHNHNGLDVTFACSKAIERLIECSLQC
jgi:hypothetical protein